VKEKVHPPHAMTDHSPFVAKVVVEVHHALLKPERPFLLGVGGIELTGVPK
jgi:hypothetical protein